MREAVCIKGPNLEDERTIYGGNLNPRRDTVTQQLQETLEEDKSKKGKVTKVWSVYLISAH